MTPESPVRDPAIPGGSPRGDAARYTAVLRSGDGDPLAALARQLLQELSARSIWCGELDERTPATSRWRRIATKEGEGDDEADWVARVTASAVAAGGAASGRTPQGWAAAAVAPAGPERSLALAACLDAPRRGAWRRLQTAVFAWSTHQLAQALSRRGHAGDAAVLAADAATIARLTAAGDQRRLLEEAGRRLGCELVLVGPDAGAMEAAADEALLQAAAREAISRGQPVQWPLEVPGWPVSLAAKAAARSGQHHWLGLLPAVVAGPQEGAAAAEHAAGRAVLAARLPRGAGDSESTAAATDFARCGAMLPLLLAAIQVQRGAAPSAASGKRIPPVLMRLALLLGVLASLWPTSWSRPVPCTLEAARTRTITAPLDTILLESLVAPGQPVRRDQLLAKCDRRSLLTELARLEAEGQSQARRAAVAQAAGDWAAAQISRLEVHRVQGRLELLQRQLEELEIRSPLDGVVLEAALRGQSNAPLRAGEPLFVISSLDRFRGRLQLEESRLASLREGQEVRLRLDAEPGQLVAGRVRRVHPRAIRQQHEMVFVAEVDLQRTSAAWRPGMQGRAWLRGPLRPWIWNWIGPPLQRLRTWIAW